MTRSPEEPVDEEVSLASHLREVARLLATRDVGYLALLEDAGEASQEWQTTLKRIAAASTGPVGDPRPFGRTRKVSVSLPEGLTAAVQRRVGKGEFSHYVAEAVARRLELDLLAELATLLDAEHGPVPDELMADAGAAWPDVE